MNTEVRTAYERRMSIWKTLLLIALVALFADKVSAQAPPFIVQKDGVSQFGANCLAARDPTSPVYNFLTNCAPPVNPPHDPDAMQSAVATYLLHEPPCVGTVTGLENFGSLMKGGINLPAIGWPYRSTVVNITIPAGTVYYGPVIQLPTNPGTLPHSLKGDIWGGNGTCYKVSPTGVTIHVEIVAIQGSRAPVGKCGGDFAFGSPWITIQPLADTATPTNMTYCNVFYPAGANTLGQYRIKAKAINGAAISTDLNWR